ncbi:DEAD/DEAH box helicase family protein [Modicisalibacter tunisiensis]|uniref:DEAD/DEAH box helicase family protein n=1 Tax=Modicisalibacter tunisiensis TaxID=390637 RepID=UPI001CCA2E0F|nr:DEAD/DEAH box helicase family protein [Modicisalibacter tunisiensis]MBZ9540226.1 DEAD/DEAH box helicase family protein [Modicisalibacter tunisiensis]
MSDLVTDNREQLQLADALTQHTNTLCSGLEDGTAEIFKRVTPTTAELLTWWFGAEMVAARPGLNFHPGQRQAILNTLVAHEVLDCTSVKALYQKIAPDALQTGHRLSEVSSDKHAHPKYCLKMATGTGKTWVLQALLVWQLLNKRAALEAGLDDPRFTRNFLIVAPGLIVYERLLEAFLGKEVQGRRDFASSDVARYAELFIPEPYREHVFGFVRGNTCPKAEIGLRTTGNGLLAICNWHLLSDAAEDDDTYEASPPGSLAEPKDVIAGLLPLQPGKAAGNSLDVLDRRHARGQVLDYLAGLDELMVFNDEAHHIHEFKREGEVTEVEWQKSLSLIAASKGRRFVQVDFSATPYNDVGSGKKKRKLYFPHIITDFDLKTAMAEGLVKSLVLDRRKELGALPLEFTAERDADGNPVLSEGQRIMLRAGLQKLRKLESDFAAIDPSRHPKMLVVCEDTKVSPLVTQFLSDEGLADDEVMTIDSGKKAELGEKSWIPIRERLFNLDAHATPRVVVSVLMLREGFDVNNICVIVPLRSSQAQILLEQTIGRGLRLMWRDPEYDDTKAENRALLKNGQEPNNLIDVLTIIEHPAFQAFYNELMLEGLAGTTGDDNDSTTTTGDMLAVGLREDHAQYDFAIPFILRDSDEWLEHQAPDVAELKPFTQFSLAQLKAMLGKGDVFNSQDLQSQTLFGDYRVDGAVMNVSGYNDLLGRLTRRIAQALSQPLPKGNKIAAHVAKPYLQVNTAELAGWIESYIEDQLFGEPFEPLVDENWRLLLLQPVLDHITRIFALALIEAEQTQSSGTLDVKHRYLSEVPRLMMREKHSQAVNKCIYERQGWSARHGGLEHSFIQWASSDASVAAFCKINENRHTFARLRYVRQDGLPAFYCPDFLVRTQDAIYLVETKAQKDVNHPDVRRKLKATQTWCERINALPAENRQTLPWFYVLLGESVFYEWKSKGASLDELLRFAKEQPIESAITSQSNLF